MRGYLPVPNSDGQVGALLDLAPEQVKAIAAGDLTQLESMLLTQAVALQAMFSDLARRGRDQPHCRFPFKLSLSIFHVVTDPVTSPHVSPRSRRERVLT